MTTSSGSWSRTKWYQRVSWRSKVMPPPSLPPSSLCLDEDVLVFRVQHTFTDELLSDGNGHVVGHTQVWQVVQKPAQTHRQDLRLTKQQTNGTLASTCSSPLHVYLGSRFLRTRLTKVSTSVLVMCFSSSFRLLCSRAVMVSSAKMS